MLRMIFLVALVFTSSLLLRAEINPAQTTSGALVQAQDCLDMPAPQVTAAPSDVNAEGLSFRGLGATLGIGLMTVMFFVPAALVAELLMRRGEGRGRAGTV